MRKLALVLTLLPFAACSTTGPTAEQRERGIKSVSSLSSKYERDTFFARVRQRCVRQLSAMLGAPRYAALHAQGAALDEGAALALALEPPVKHLKHPPPGSHGAG